MTQVTIPTAIGGDGLPFSDDGTSARDMQGQGYASHFLPMINQVVAANAIAVQAAGAIATGSTNTTSSTSLTISTGSKSLTVQTGKALVPGMWVLLAYSAAPANNMAGQVTSYNAGTGALVLNVTATSGAGTYANWSGSVTGAPAAVPGIARAAKTSAYTLVSADKGALIDCRGTWTLGLAAAATLAAGWWCYVRNTSNGDITIDPDGSELIDGASTLVMKPGFIYLLQCDGVGFSVITVKRRTYERRSLITTSGTFVAPEDCFVIRPYAFGSGANAVSGTGGAGGGCAYGDIAVVPGQVVTLSIASGVATVTASAIALLTANPASGVTPGTASKHSSVTNGGAYSGGASGSGQGGGSSGSPLGNGQAGGAAGGGGGGWGSSGGHNGGGGGGAGPKVPTKNGGNGFDPVIRPIDPLLSDLVGVGGAGSVTAGYNADDGGPGGGGGVSISANGGYGGFGGGGGGSGSSGGFGGNGGFGGGGGGGNSSGGTGGTGGYGGGGGGGVNGGSGGPAAIIIIY